MDAAEEEEEGEEGEMVASDLEIDYEGKGIFCYILKADLSGYASL